MKLLIGLLAATGLSAAAFAQSGATSGAQTPAPAAAPARTDADPAMWIVRDADTTIYLFGTFHMLDSRTDWFNDEVRTAFDRSQELVTEIDIPDDLAAVARTMQPLVARYAIDPQGRTLSSRLTPEQNRQLNTIIREIGAPEGSFDRFEPWFAAMTLAAVAAQRLGMTPANGAEQVLKRAAAGRQMTFGAVETMEGQIQMLDGMPEDAQLAQLRDTLEDMSQLQTMLPRMLAVWSAGDAEGMDRLLNEGMENNAQLRRILLGARNERWAEWIDERMDRPGTVFMAVGAGHLVGPDSVQAFLARRNLQATRVPSAG